MPFERSHQIFVIVRIFLNSPEFQTAFGGFSDQGQRYNPTINVLISQGKIPPYARVIHTASNFPKDYSGTDKMKRPVLYQKTKDTSRRSLRTNQLADIDIGIKNGLNHTLLPARSRSSMFGLVRQLIGESLNDRFRFSIKDRQQVQSRRLLHLLEPFDGNHRRQRLSLVLNHEFIVPQRYPIQQVSKPLTDFQGGRPPITKPIPPERRRSHFIPS